MWRILCSQEYRYTARAGYKAFLILLEKNDTTLRALSWCERQPGPVDRAIYLRIRNQVRLFTISNSTN